MQRYRITVEEITPNETIPTGSFECDDQHLDVIKAIRDLAYARIAPQIVHGGVRSRNENVKAWLIPSAPPEKADSKPTVIDAGQF